MMAHILTTIRLLLVLALLLPTSVWAISLDQSTATDTAADPGTATRDLSFGTLPAAGSFVVGCLSGGDFSGNNIDFVSGFADNQGNGAYSVIKKTPAASGIAEAAIFYKENVASSGTFTVTFTATNSTLLAYHWKIFSFTGMALSSALDQQASAGAITAETSLTATTPTTTLADELVIACAGMTGAGTDSNVNLVQNTAGYTLGWQIQDNTTTPVGMMNYKIVSAIGAQATNWSFDSLSTTAGIIGTFKAVVNCTGGLAALGAGRSC